MDNTHKLFVYRITYTNPNGFVIELPWLQMKEFCNKYNLSVVEELFYGTAGELCELYSEDFSLKNLYQIINSNFVSNKKCNFNKNLPEEGVVIRIDGLEQCQSFKLKSIDFLERETKLLDKGEIDIESNE